MRWIKLYTDIKTDDKVALLPNDQQRWAWIAVLVAAGAQDGRPWRNRKHLDVCLTATERRHVGTLIQAGLLRVEESGEVVIPAWGDYQAPMRFKSHAQRNGQPRNSHASATHEGGKRREEDRRGEETRTPLPPYNRDGVESIGAIINRTERKATGGR